MFVAYTIQCQSPVVLAHVRSRHFSLSKQGDGVKNSVKSFNMGSKIEYVESSHIYATTYVRNSKGIGVLWAIFTICYAIISVVAFITPEWIGDVEAENPGRFGLWTVCQTGENGEVCTGRLDDFPSISSTAFQASTVFVGVAVVFAIMTLCAMVLFFFCQSTSVFHICGWMQIISG